MYYQYQSLCALCIVGSFNKLHFGAYGIKTVCCRNISLFLLVVYVDYEVKYSI